jgi:hypothetical protein
LGSGTDTVKVMGEVDKAAATVMRAMQALDAHRHETAPTLEREYRAALEAYFIVSERAAGREHADGEPIEDIPGWDAEEALASLEEEARAADLREGLGSIEGHYAAARRALRLARAYRAEPGTSGRRERECVAAALRHREAIHALRLRLKPPAEQLLLPGLAKTRAPSVEEQRAARTG